MRGSIIKRGKSYSIIVELGRDGNGKRKQKWFSGYKTKKEAEKELNEILVKLEKGDYFESEKMALKDYLEYWLSTYAKVNLAPSTYKRYTEFSNTIKKHLGTIELNKLKPANIQNFYSNLIEEGKLSNSTILKIHRMLHLSLKHAVQWQMTSNNPSDAVQAPRADKVEMKIWSVEEANEFLQKIKGTTLYMPVLLALQTGMRQGEICALMWDNIDLKAKSISVVNSLQKIDGNLTLKKPKTKNSIRNIALMDTTSRELFIHKKKQNELKLYMGGEYINDNFVCSWEDGRPLDPMYIAKKFNKVVRDLGFKQIRFHDLRHTHATMLLQNGIHPKIVSERLGHSQIGITLDTYSHVLPNMQKEAVQRLDEMFAK